MVIVADVDRIVSIYLIDLIIEFIFTKSTSEIVIVELQAQFNAVVVAILSVYCLNSSRDEVFESKETVFIRIQDWAFIKSFVIIKELVKMKNG